jgi:hypothetical protein
MADDKTAPETPLQPEEHRVKVLAQTSAGIGTAAGQERARIHEGAEDERPTERGSTIPIVGGNPKPDFPPHTAPAPIGAQAEPSQFSTNGSLPVGMVASPSGSVPVSAVTSDPHQGAKLVQENLDSAAKASLKSGATKLSRAKIESMSAGELRAVAQDRGYDIGDYSGARRTRLRFIAQQNQDEGLEQNTDDAPETEPSSDSPSGNV